MLDLYVLFYDLVERVLKFGWINLD